MDDSQKTDDKDASMRIRFSEEESKFPWLSMLLDAYAIIDKGVAVAVKAEEEERNTELACKEGCGNCCRTHSDIPLYPLELIGIYWFATEKIALPLRDILKIQLSGHTGDGPCPFLIDNSCSIHPLRPVSCRQFNIFNEPCDEGEDPYYTRRDDVLTPLEEYTNRAFAAMLSFYGIADGTDRTKAVSAIIHTQVINLQTFEWKKLVRIMENFDSKKHGP